MLEKFEYAIRHKQKVLFRMEDTPTDKSILFHPYAVIISLFEGKVQVAGIIEEHYATTERNYWRYPNVAKVASVEIISDSNFEPDTDWKKHVDQQMFDIKLSVS